MQNSKNTFLFTIFSFLFFSLANIAVAQTMGNLKSFGRGSPFTLEDLPPGLLKQNLRQLSGPAKDKAMNWLHNFEFTELDVADLRVDSDGGIFFVDPLRVNNQENVASSSESTFPLTEQQTFNLHSKPGASRVVHLDMDGRIVTGTRWNDNAGVDPLYMRPYDSDGNEASLSQAELNAIAEVWKRIAEDFAPFDIDVTTEEPASYGPQVGVILVTYNADENGRQIYPCSCGGVAYVGVWGESNYSYYQPALVFIDGVGTGPHNISEAASHELGHNLSLSHDGTSTQGYYAGHGSGSTSWAPIMGVGYYKNVTQWSKGEYADASQTQDDLQIISQHLTYRGDDHDDINVSLATPLLITNATDVIATTPVSDAQNINPNNKGIIDHHTDIDLFSLDVGNGEINLTITPGWIDSYQSQSLRGMNIDLSVTLYDESGTIELASNNPFSDTNALITTTVNAGTYILSVEGSGLGEPLIDGYSGYSSLGSYYITGTVPEPINSTSPPPNPTGLVATASGDVDVALSWIDADSTEENNESGYRILRSLDGASFSEVTQTPRDTQNYVNTINVTGEYRYQVVAFNTAGEKASNISNTIYVDVPVAATVELVYSESSEQGSITSGSYSSTRQLAESETVQEQHQGGRPANRVSQLSHYWYITDVLAANSVVLEVVAETPVNAENDNFIFEYAINEGSYQTLGLLNNGTGLNTFVSNLPTGTEGNITLRVFDTDRTIGRGKNNSLSISYIAVTSNGNLADLPPQITITSPGDNDSFIKGDSVVFEAAAIDDNDGDLSTSIQWTSSLDGVVGLGANVTNDQLKAGTHIITATVEDSASNFGNSSVTVTILPIPSGIDLQVTAAKHKGKHAPVLGWSGTSSASVKILRDGSMIETVPDTGNYTDNTENKGARTYTYQVCEQETSFCSNEVPVVY